MRHPLLLTLLVSCAPLSPGQEGHSSITGRELTEAEESNLRDRVAAGYACARRMGKRPKQHVRRIHIEPTCAFMHGGFKVRGWNAGRDVWVGYCTRAAGHETLSVAFGHSDQPGSVPIKCEHEGPKPFACTCPETEKP